ncbi:MAG: SDR family NAD(P)-dependent oxidoreductase [Planctomycetota bacterium]
MDSVRRTDLSTTKLAIASRERVGPALPWVRSEPVAVVGIGCRFPGADGPEEFLELLREGRDAVRELPDGRWDRERYHDPDPDAPGKTYVTRGGYLDDVASFDAARFGIAPAEALRMDPQQRLLLEVSWHALEHAAIAPESLYGGSAGVFFGISSGDYSSVLRRTTLPEEIDGYVATGNSFSVAAGRVSYVLGLTGPSFAVDTACSSSLVSIHLALQSLRLRECDVALAGGVNLLLEPESTVNFAKARMLAPDGRIKAYDARADGFVRGEGCGVVVLKRLSDAIADGDDVWAVLRGSAVNQDGASSGLTAPNGTSQRAVLRAALEGSGVEPRQVGLIEGHGTGTALGDPIELGALADVYGAGRPAERPLALGSVKANIGHLESAAGVAGLVKAVLALRHRELFAQANFEAPSTHVDWSGSGLEVVRGRSAFEPIEGRRLAAVSSFGFGGTNAHVVLEEAPNLSPGEARAEGPFAVVLGARDAGRVEALAGTWANALERTPNDRLSGFARAAWLGRDRGPERIAATGADGPELAENLRAAVARQTRQGAARGRVRTGAAAGKLAFLFSGQGSAWVGMGLALREREPVFRETLDRCASVLGERALLDPARVDGERVIDTGDAQPALFAFEVAMAALLRSRGIEPDYVLGHSVGELAAACVAGVLGIEDAARLVRVRAERMSALPAGGKMVALPLEPERVERAVRAAGDDVSIAAFNGPRQVVVSGSAAAVDALIASLGVEATAAQTLPVSHAFHSARMEPALDELRDAAASIRFQPPRIPLVSSFTGTLAGSEIGRPEHWVRQLREPVRFADAIDALWTAGVQELVEVGPGAALTGLTRGILAEDPNVLAVATATRRRGELLTLFDAVGALAVRRDDRDLGPWLGDGPRSASAPRTPFQRTRIWPAERQVETAVQTGDVDPERAPADAWGWTPSFRRLAAPARAATPGAPVAVLGEGCADGIAAALEARAVPVQRASLESPLTFEPSDQAARVVVVLPPHGSTAWARTLAESLAGDRATLLTLVTTGAHEVTGVEELDPSAAAVAAVGEVLGQELASARVRRVDLDPAARLLPPALVDELLADPDDPATPRVAAYRGPHRWALDHLPAPLRTPTACAEAESSAPAGDTVALIGRLAGGLGERVATYLLRRGARRVIALGSGLDGGCAEQAAALARLREVAGHPARIVARAADVGDPVSLADALAAAEADCGPIDAVVHAGASGRPEIARLLVQDERPSATELARERVDGLPALAQALGSRRPRYVLVVTSLSAQVGGVGFADYAAANAFAEAFVQRHARTADVPWSTVAFEALREELGHGLDRLGEGNALRRIALSDEDVEHALDRLGLADAPPPGPLLVVPSDAAQRVERAHTPAARDEAAASAASVATGGDAPRDDVESTLVEIWEEFLPVRPIGVHDDYFALGGTSLAAVQILSRLKARFAVEVPLEALLGKEPTIAAVADAVRRLTAPSEPANGAAALPDGDAELEEMLALVEQLSPDEAERALGEERPR